MIRNEFAAKVETSVSYFLRQIEEMVTNMIHFGYGIAEIVFIWIELSFLGLYFTTLFIDSL